MASGSQVQGGVTEPEELRYTQSQRIKVSGWEECMASPAEQYARTAKNNYTAVHV